MTATTGDTSEGLQSPDPGPYPASRIAGLEGIRGLAALFVVVHHCFLSAFPGYPRMTGPWWAGWMIYGHLAVVVFIVLSGFSLAVSPGRHGWRLNGLGRYAHRRAWRILSAYWPALVFSLVMARVFVTQPGEGSPTARSAVVYGLLIQDVTGAPSPNGAFWSIAVEAQLYVALPLLLLFLRKQGPALMLAAVMLPVLVIGTFAASVPVLDMLTRFTPQLAVGFTVGVAAAWFASDERSRRLPLLWYAAGAAVPSLLLIAALGSTRTIDHYFWIDLAVMPAIALVLCSLGAGGGRGLARLLDLGPLRGLGGFSYSLYLVHAPIVVAVSALLVRPRLGTGVTSLLLTLAIALPLSLVVSRLFAALFDLPFQRHKSWRSLTDAMRSRLDVMHGGRPTPQVEGETTPTPHG
jgi:peptidoglycan/LPS O-acetylase OafA/YrhL